MQATVGTRNVGEAPFVDTRSRTRVVRPRGDIGRALADGARLLRHIGPETPRPLDLLTAVSGDERLTARDHVLWDLLVATAYQRAYHARRTGAPVVVGTEISVPLRDVVAYLGTAARRADVVASLGALSAMSITVSGIRGRRFVMPMLAAGDVADGDVRFALPTSLWTLLATQRRYAYLELDALARMGSRHAVRLYRHLVAHVSGYGLRWSPQCADWTLEIPAREMALALGLPEGAPGSRVGEALSRCLPDLEAVRAFSVALGEPRRRAARGAPVEAYRLILRAKEPNAYAAPSLPYDEKRARLDGVRDAPRYRVAEHVWRKGAVLGGTFFPQLLLDGWLVALDEALSGAAVDGKGAGRRYRGPALLRAIDDVGASRAAFLFCAEEALESDLTRLGFPDDLARKSRAKAARAERWTAHLASLPPKPKGTKVEKAAPMKLRRVTGLARLAVEDDEGGWGVVLRLGPGRSRHDARQHAPAVFADVGWTGRRPVELFAEYVSRVEREWVRVPLGKHPASEADLERVVGSVGMLFVSWRRDDPAFDVANVAEDKDEDISSDIMVEASESLEADDMKSIRLSPGSVSLPWFSIPAGSHLDCDEFADDERDEDEDDLTLGVPDDDFEEPDWP